jgi:UDP-N-acetylglucosamine 2-epimerase
MLERIEQCLTAEKPDYALVYGDTNFILAGVPNHVDGL